MLAAPPSISSISRFIPSRAKNPLRWAMWKCSAETALKRSLECVSKNWVVSFAPVVYGIGLSVVGTLVAPFGMIGGLLYSLASAGCASSALFLIKNMVESGKTDVRDFVNGFTVYIWEVITIGFILW